MFVSKGSDLLNAQLKAAYAIKGIVFKQAMVLTYNDVFMLVGFFFAICLPLLLLFRIKGKGKNLEKVEQKVEAHLAD